jgi:hypothetical protein
VLAITETWVSSIACDDPVIKDTLPVGYSIMQVPRYKRKGGGVAIIARDCFKKAREPQYKAQSFECIEATLSHQSVCIRLAVIYRPPPSPKNGFTICQFLEEFAIFLEKHTLSTGFLLIVGDFNFHWEKTTDANCIKLKNMLDSSNLVQHVKDPTHIRGHILDLVISRNEDSIVQSTSVSSLLSDHHAVHCSLSFQKPPLPRKTIHFRKYKAIDQKQFKEDILSSSLYHSATMDAEELHIQYMKTLSLLIDKHAPQKTKTIVIRPVTPWFGPDIAQAKRERRKYEKLWRKTKLTVHRSMYIDMRQQVNRLVKKCKVEYFNKKVSDCPDQKALFNLVKELLHTKESSPLPVHNSLDELVCEFSNFFRNKIMLIRENLDNDDGKCHNLYHHTPVENRSESSLTAFRPLAEQEVIKLVRQSPNKSCLLDPIPTWLLKEHLDVLSPIITTIVNTSLESSTVPQSMKNAIVRPLIKKSSLDANHLKNYRPVSNLTFTSKITEKAVDFQLSNHLVENDLLPTIQSAYRPNHSVETALLKVHNDILRAVDESKGVILVLLDLSAAFDTIDHDKLLERLEHSMGIRDEALAWMKSYLTDRTQAVHINGVTSEHTVLKYGVPQGAVLGPKDFTMYTPLIASIAELHDVLVHLYADDTQLYIPFSLDSPHYLTQAMRKIQLCVKDIASWMRENKLQLNMDKTEVMIITSARQSHKVNIEEINIGDSVITPAKVIRNLGAMFDSKMTMEPQVQAVCRATNYQLRRLGHIRKFLTRPSTEKIVHAVVTSRLDCNNALLYGLPDTLISKLQRLQNTAARIVTRKRKHEHITPTLKDLHWLPVHQRILYKMLLLTYKCLNNLAPQYLTDMIIPYHPARSLRSQEKCLLKVPNTRLITYGDRAFSKAAPELWNQLPQSVKCAPSLDLFKTNLKTHLFKSAF